ncbi:putative WW domain, parvalbumin, EF-hand domain pair, peptidase C2, calpain family [Plasmopara halstedii]
MPSKVENSDNIDCYTLQLELQKLGIHVVSSRQDTVVSVKIKGLAGRALNQGLRLADQLLQAKFKHAIQLHTDSATKLFIDPTFGPCTTDIDGAAAMCKAGANIPSKGGSQHQAKVLGLLQHGKIRWERPIYASNDEADKSLMLNDEDECSTDNVFASNATLFADGASSGDVIQGNLGDCWFLSALSVVATRSDILEQNFWRKDLYKSRGLFVCRFMKNFVWNYILIDDRLPVFGFSDFKEGKPYFARCRNPNELWVSLLEKAYAKLHGSYEALTGGFVDCALNDLTGMCSEQVILKEGFPGYGESPYEPVKPLQKHGDPFWGKINRYRDCGSLMGCSIQPQTKEVAIESSAGNGLYFKHAYALVDAAEIKTVEGESVRLLKLRNPWGMGEWTGPWSDSSDERTINEDAIAKYFKIINRKVGANAEKRVFMTMNARGVVGADTIAQEEEIEINANDGTFFMSFEAWMQSFTHFFAGIDFPDSWHGRRSEGCWNEANCGGNTTKSTWVNNPRFELALEQRAQIFVSLSQEDPRGSDILKIVPIGFHICSLSPVKNDPNKFETREPANKLDAYYRAYKPAERESYQSGRRSEPLPPAIMPGTVIPGIDDDGVPQPAYTFKQAVSVEATMEPGRYCIIPSMYMRTEKTSGSTNVGNFWISVYSDKPTFRLEGGEKIVEEEEGDEEKVNTDQPSNQRKSVDFGHKSKRHFVISSNQNLETILKSRSASVAGKRQRFEIEKQEILKQAKRIGIGLRELRATFAKFPKLSKAECRSKLQKLGFNVSCWDDDTLGFFSGRGEKSGMIQTDYILQLFASDLEEKNTILELPDMEEDGDTPNSIHREGILEIELLGATGLTICRKRKGIQRQAQITAPTFSPSETCLRQQIGREILDRDLTMARQLDHFAKKSVLLAKAHKASRQTIIGASKYSMQKTTPVTAFYELLEREYTAQKLSTLNSNDNLDDQMSDSQILDHSTQIETSSFYSAQSPNDIQGWTQPINNQTALELHKSNHFRDLEVKRSARLKSLLQHKQIALGDAEKTAALPRLIGGKKSGSNYIKCIDCGTRVFISGRSKRFVEASEEPTSFLCNGSNCVNVFCSPCFSLLPEKNKVCEECFQHEILSDETFGEQLRSILIEKIGGSDQQRSHLERVFHSFDADGSGSLSSQEFEKMLELLDIQPALKQNQIASLIEQFDANGDGEISLIEFKHWILTDHVWTESVASPTSRMDTPHNVAQVLETIISPLCNDIIDVAYSAYALSSTIKSWSSSSNFTTEANKTSQSDESGVILFQRVMGLSSLSAETSNVLVEVFEQLNNDASDSIDQFDFVDYFAVLGIHFNFEDALLIMNRLGATSTAHESTTIQKAVFMKYVETISTKSFMRQRDDQASSLSNILLKLDEIAQTSLSVRTMLQDELQQLHGNMTNNELISLCQSIYSKVELDVTVNDLKSLAFNLTFHHDVFTNDQSSVPKIKREEQLLSLKSSGDVLARALLTESGNLMAYVRTFDADAIFAKLSAHLQKRSGTLDIKIIWKNVFGADPADAIYLNDFVRGVLKTGFEIGTGIGSNSVPDDRLLTKVLIALSLDVVRIDYRVKFPATLNWNDPVLDFNLFQIIMRLKNLKDLESQINHALINFSQLCNGEHQYLVTMALDANRNLIIRARDPIFKLTADLILCENEFDLQNLLAQVQFQDFESRQQKIHEKSREASFIQSPHGLITSDLYPKLNASMLAIIERTRVEQKCQRVYTKSQFAVRVLGLTLVESNAFISTLRNLLSKYEFPFYWSINQRSLVFSIDSEYFDQLGKPSFQQLVADTISERSTPSLRALATFVAHTASTLRVCYHIVGKYSKAETSWQEFQDLISGHQDAYAVLHLHPHGSTYTTGVSRVSGSGAVQWNFQTLIAIQEPNVCDYRIDRPVIFTDTVKVACTPESSPSVESISFIVGDHDENLGHFVVLSVRRALPNGLQAPKPRLYCTAYDPLTSCDYAVEGYPSDWPIDFFDVSVNPSFESQWQAMLCNMRLGQTITPELVISVYNKLPKTDKLIGECQVAVGSAIAQEGHNFKKNITLQSATSTSAGVMALTFRFDVSKTPNTKPSLTGSEDYHSGSREQIKSGVQYSPEVRTELVHNSFDDRSNQLPVFTPLSGTAECTAREQVKQLQAQLQQLSNIANKTSDDEAERWKRRLKQARQEQRAIDEQHAATLADFQEEIRCLRQQIESRTSDTQKVNHLKHFQLAPHASANEIFSTIRETLMSRCPDRPYLGLKKALVAEAEVSGTVTFAVLNEVLSDFGLALLSKQRANLMNVLDPELNGRVSIDDFFYNLCGDAEAYDKTMNPRRPMSSTRERISPVVLTLASEPVVLKVRPTPPSQKPISPLPPPMRASKGRNMTWQEMKQFLVSNVPDGWETRFTEKGRPYYCNHASRSTQWKHPRSETEAIFSEWVQQNGANFNRKATSTRAFTT